MCRFLHKSLVDRSIGAQADIVLIEYISLNLCAENRIIRPKKVRGTTSATSNAIMGITAQQKDGLLTLTLYSISRETPTGTSLFFSCHSSSPVSSMSISLVSRLSRSRSCLRCCASSGYLGTRTDQPCIKARRSSLGRSLWAIHFK